MILDLARAAISEAVRDLALARCCARACAQTYVTSSRPLRRARAQADALSKIGIRSNPRSPGRWWPSSCARSPRSSTPPRSRTVAARRQEARCRRSTPPFARSARRCRSWRWHRRDRSDPRPQCEPVGPLNRFPITDEPWGEPPEELYTLTKSGSECPRARYVELSFERGVPVGSTASRCPWSL